MIGRTRSRYVPLADKILEKHRQKECGQVGGGGREVLHVGRFAESTRSGQRPDLQYLTV
jgi:hypothetical protein